MFSGSLEIVVEIRDPAHSHLVNRVNNRITVETEFFRHFEEPDNRTGRCLDFHPAGGDPADDSAQTAEPSRGSRGGAFGLPNLHVTVGGSGVLQSP